jgi:hypothetical protein
VTQGPDPTPSKADGRRLPAWLLGLVIAVVVFIVVIVVMNVLGYGDDPVVGGMARVTG